MVTVDGNILTLFVSMTASSVTAFLPLMTAIMAVFVAFAILNMIAHFIKKAAK